LEGQRFAVIHFNCGLHDIKRPHGKDSVQVPLEEYRANLLAVVKLLRDYAEALIWARTTPLVDGQHNPVKSFDRFNQDVNTYNQAADQIMADLSIPINDLHGVVVRNGIARCLSRDGTHMTEIGYQALGNAVGAAIRQHQPQRPKSSGYAQQEAI